MSFWNEPENNGIKALILMALAAVAGYFIYYAVHKNALRALAACSRQK